MSTRWSEENSIADALKRYRRLMDENNVKALEQFMSFSPDERMEFLWHVLTNLTMAVHELHNMIEDAPLGDPPHVEETDH